MLKKIIGQLLLIAFILPSYTLAGDYSYIDMHLHYMDFVQQTQGFDVLLTKMDEQGVSNSVIMGMPYSIQITESSVGDPVSYLSDDSKVFWYPLTDIFMMDDYLKLSPEDQKRFYPFLGGANTNNINSARELERVLEMYPGKFKGIGELMFRHDFLTWKSAEPPPLPDNAAADAIFKLAARYSLPVVIHHNITSMRSRDPIYLPELERALQNNPATNIIWAHAGQSYYVHVDNLCSILDDALASYPNLYIDLSWVVLDQDILKTQQTLKNWVHLIERYPERFLIGSDIVGFFDTYNIRRYDPLLDSLKETTARGLARENFLRLIGD